MKRRYFLALVAASAATAAAPRLSLAQQAAKVPRLAILSTPMTQAQHDVFFQGLADYGYLDGKNIVVELFTAPTIADIPAFAERAVASKPDVIVARNSPAPLAVKALTSVIPIVFTALQDPVSIGLVSNLARPGGNLTGNTLMGLQLVGKQFSILRELIPQLTRVAVFTLPADPISNFLAEQASAAAHALNIETTIIEVKQGDEWEPLFARAVAARAQAAYFIMVNYFGGINAKAMVDLALLHKLPLMISQTGNVELGGLVSYGANSNAVFRRSAYYVDQILKGAKPGDLPVEQPSTFEFAINLKTAKALGLTVPQTILFQATEVIEEDGTIH